MPSGSPLACSVQMITVAGRLQVLRCSPADVHATRATRQCFLGPSTWDRAQSFTRPDSEVKGTSAIVIAYPDKRSTAISTRPAADLGACFIKPSPASRLALSLHLIKGAAQARKYRTERNRGLTSMKNTSNTISFRIFPEAQTFSIVFQSRK